eukprot:TRINITY_DN11028_c0_g1_i2.p1 TRINITY_DN11028_c0_g1~~TRINITY_DN11028_c0_g1_i2.p1  ORF type:complete len:1167 (+),score=239.41 TRINITY_DN11028_c0_g1_i2:219-3503(+)
MVKAARALQRERLKHDEKAKQAFLDSVAVAPQAGLAGRIRQFRAISSRPIPTNIPQLARLMSADSSVILSCFPCMLMALFGRSTPRIVVLTERVIFILDPKDLANPKRLLHLAEVEGIVELLDMPDSTLMGVRCSLPEIDLLLYIQTIEMKEHFIAALYVAFEKQGRKLKMWQTTSAIEKVLKLVTAGKEPPFIPMLRGPNDTLDFCNNHALTQELLLNGDTTIFISEELLAPAGSKLIVTDFALYERSSRDRLQRRYEIAYFKYLIEDSSDPKYFSFSLHDRDKSQFQLRTEHRSWLIDYFKTARPDLKVLSIQQHKAIEAEEQEKRIKEAEVDLAKEDAFLEEERRKREQRLLEENFHRLADKRNELIDHAVNMEHERMREFAKKRKEDLIEGLATRNQQRDEQRKGALEQASFKMAQLTALIEAERTALAEERKLHTEEEAKIKRERAAAKPKRAPAGLEECIALQSQLEDERHSRQTVREELTNRLQEVNRQVESQQQQRAQFWEKEFKSKQDALDALRAQIAAEISGREKDLQRANEAIEFEKRQLAKSSEKKLAVQVRELQALMAKEDDTQLAGKEELLKERKEQLALRNAFMKRRERERQEHEEAQKQLQEQLSGVKTELDKQHARKLLLDAQVDALRSEIADVQKKRSDCQCKELESVCEYEKKQQQVENERLKVAREERKVEEEQFSSLKLKTVVQEGHLAADAARESIKPLLEELLRLEKVPPLSDPVLLNQLDLSKRNLKLVEDSKAQNDARNRELQEILTSLTAQLQKLGSEVDVLREKKAELERKLQPLLEMERTQKEVERELKEMRAHKALTTSTPQLARSITDEPTAEEKQLQEMIESQRNALHAELSKLKQQQAKVLPNPVMKQPSFPSLPSSRSVSPPPSPHPVSRGLDSIRVQGQSIKGPSLRYLVDIPPPEEVDSGVPVQLGVAKYRPSCYEVVQSKLLCKTKMASVAILDKLIHSGKHRWLVTTITGGIKLGIGTRSITVMNYAGLDQSWVLCSSGETEHAQQRRPCLPALKPGDQVSLMVDLDSMGGMLAFSVNDCSPQVAFTQLRVHRPFVAIIELASRGDSCSLLEYQWQE